jgi:hypothetical protein
LSQLTPTWPACISVDFDINNVEEIRSVFSDHRGFIVHSRDGASEMVDFQGIPAYTPGESLAEKRRADADMPGIQSKSQPMGGKQSFASLQAFNQPIRDYSTLQFQSPQARSPLVQISEPVKLPNMATIQANYTGMFQNLAGHLERVISQIGAFFFGQRRNRPSEDEMDKRRLNDFFSLEFLGGDPDSQKVEASNRSADGSSSQ